MALIKISLVSAYDTSTPTMCGTQIDDMFNPLQPPETIETTKADEAVARAIAIATAFAEKNPGVSFIPSFLIKDHERKPAHYKTKTATSNPALRKWLLRKK